jgi:hypothetical protein
MKTTQVFEMKNQSQFTRNWFAGNDFFNTIIEDQSEKNFFITSECYDDTFPKKYSLRFYNENTKKILTVGDFQRHDVLINAKTRKEIFIKGFKYVRENGGFREKNILENVDKIECYNNLNYMYKISMYENNEEKYFLLDMNDFNNIKITC